jgi:predicted alpha/beta superfamily hydrolase
MGMVTEFVREAAWCGRSFDAIVVGIGYPNADTPQESWRRVYVERAADLTPMRLSNDEKEGSAWTRREVKTGSGDKFLAFLKEELIPWVERNYRADPAKRIFVGHSYGGLFALHAALTEPNLFRSYIAASPHLREEAQAIFELEREFVKTHDTLDAQIFLAAGELEDSDQDSTVRDMKRMAEILETRKYKGLSVKIQVFADNNHCEAAAPALHAGLKWMLKK